MLVQLALIGYWSFILSLASIQTISKSAVSEKEKSEKSICHARHKGYLEIHLNYFFIKAQRKFSIFDEIIVKFSILLVQLCVLWRGVVGYSILF